MKKRINVIDLDNTLIPFDSFRKLVFKEIFKCNVKIIIISFLRFLRLISDDNFKKDIIDILDKRPSISKLYANFAEVIFKKINYDVLSLIETNTTKDRAINILCSASPNEYVQIIANRLGWVGSGSGYYDSKFINMYGENKKIFIKKKYPSDKYIYNFSISDSKSDLDLLKMFDNYMLFEK
jgi:phosphoserine phosphatase